jgi:hypothetical protein
METCACRIDWVCCFRQDCPRAAYIRRLQEAAYEQARELLGDPRECVSVGQEADCDGGSFNGEDHAL